ncbi:hypothetical protein AXG93_4720s1050 [Marchantia polymorpha subsp. ruderalis]|uniref:L-gulonolactone oxidase n=3 Tax=Marchantia polymorpha TaxID=3197 RepID=A0A176VS47_MARPO|nr:hypothetical protein AXG93_4720s1050 [Marchantia polymorpha subsp. ruderalis]
MYYRNRQSIPLEPITSQPTAGILDSDPFSLGESNPVVSCTGTGNTSCLVYSTYGVWPDRRDCTAAKAVYPTTEQELLAAVAEGVKNGQKMRVVSKYSHSIPKLVCPGGNGAGLLISTRDYNKNIVVDTNARTATVDAGVLIKDIFDYVSSYGLAFPHSPYWDGLSISGVLGTGAHGSSTWGKGSCVYEYVIAMTMVVPASAEEGYAKVINLVSGVADGDLNAAKVSLGVLGVISRVTLQLEPQFKRKVSKVRTSDSDLETQIIVNANENEFGDITWFPSLKIAIYRQDNRVPVSTKGLGTNNFTGFQHQLAIIRATTRVLEEEDEADGDARHKCETSEVQLNILCLIGEGWTNNGFLFRGYPIVGYQNSIQTSGTCNIPIARNFACAWDPSAKGEFFFQTTFSVSFADIGSFIKDVKALVALNPDSLCTLGLYNGILIRYMKKSSGAYLGEIADSVDLDFTYYRSYDATKPRLYEDTMEEIEQMMIFKYNGKPHWGKNRPVAFVNSATLYPDLPKFLQVKDRLDPQGLFSNEWTDMVLNVGGAAARLQTFGPHCALEGLCICTDDSHCAPEAGYFCRPGLVWKDARVCRLSKSGVTS